MIQERCSLTRGSDTIKFGDDGDPNRENGNRCNEMAPGASLLTEAMIWHLAIEHPLGWFGLLDLGRQAVIGVRVGCLRVVEKYFR